MPIDMHEDKAEPCEGPRAGLKPRSLDFVRRHCRGAICIARRDDATDPRQDGSEHGRSPVCE